MRDRASGDPESTCWLGQVEPDMLWTMIAEHFQTTLRAFRRRTPFKPYVVELVSGDRIRVDHPEALVVRGGVAVYVSAAGEPVIFDNEGVSQIFGEAGSVEAA